MNRQNLFDFLLFCSRNHHDCLPDNTWNILNNIDLQNREKQYKIRIKYLEIL